MPRIDLPSYRCHQASGQAVVTLNGRDYYLGAWGSPESRTKFDRLLGEWLAGGRQMRSAVSCGELTVAEVLAAYITFAATYYVGEEGQPTNEYVSMTHAIRPVRDLYAATLVKDFGPLALKAVRERMIAGELCRRHINQRVNRIRRVFKWGVENELVLPSVLHGLQAVAPLKRGRTIARESEPVAPVPDAYVDATLPHVSRQVAAMIQLQRLTGMRPGEVVLMRPSDVDRSSAIWVYRPCKHKTAYRDHSREVFLGPQAQAILLPWMLRSAEAYCFSPAEAEDERNSRRREARKSPMTPSQSKRRPRARPKRAKRDRYDRDSYRRAVENGIKKAGVPHWHPHQLRHNCATRLRREFGLDVAQVVLGHKSLVVTQVIRRTGPRQGGGGCIKNRVRRMPMFAVVKPEQPAKKRWTEIGCLQMSFLRAPQPWADETEEGGQLTRMVVAYRSGNALALPQVSEWIDAVKYDGRRRGSKLIDSLADLYEQIKRCEDPSQALNLAFRAGQVRPCANWQITSTSTACANSSRSYRITRSYPAISANALWICSVGQR